MTPVRRLSIATLLLLGYAVMLSAVVGLGWFATSKMRQLQAITATLYSHPFAVSNAAAEMKADLFHLRVCILEAVFLPEQRNDHAAAVRQMEALARTARTDLQIIKANFLGDMARVRELESALDRWDDVRLRIMSAAAAGDYPAAANLVRTAGTPAYEDAMAPVDYILAYAQARGRQFADTAHTSSDEIIARTQVVLATLTLAILATGAVVFFRVRYLQRELHRQATLDFLTGIANRRHFMAMTEREFRLSRRHGTPFAIAVADLDLFKSINDRYGHPVGDLILKQFCAACRQALRSSDVLGRVGGEEFAILLPNTHLAAAIEVAERVRKAVAEAQVTTPQGVTVRVTGSFGLTEHDSLDQDISALFRRADAALYEAKEAGRNCVRARSP